MFKLRPSKSAQSSCRTRFMSRAKSGSTWNLNKELTFNSNPHLVQDGDIIWGKDKRSRAISSLKKQNLLSWSNPWPGTHHKEVAGPPIESTKATKATNTEILTGADERLARVVGGQHHVLHRGEESLAEHTSLPLHLGKKTSSKKNTIPPTEKEPELEEPAGIRTPELSTALGTPNLFYLLQFHKNVYRFWMLFGAFN